ncbi:MAG: hypothetical protein ACJ780_01940, partial [Solirubrobacteraceae bacterium]
MTTPMPDDRQAPRPGGDVSTAEELVRELAAIDVDGALRETAAAAVRATRRELLRAAPLGGAMGAGLVAAGTASAEERLTRNDTAMLRFDLALEYLQAGLYTEA